MSQPGTSYRAWVTACVVAEAIGMTASAGAARWAVHVAGPSGAGLDAWLIVVAGGLIEGAALGVLQARALTPLLDRTSRRAWLGVTLALAGVGWAVGSGPSTLSAGSGEVESGSTPWLLIVGGAAGLGLGMGALLGLAQGMVLRRRVARPWRWVAASSAGWALAMPVIFVGASVPSAQTPWPAVVLLGTLTGALAGLVLGGVSGWFLPLLHGGTIVNQAVLGLLGSRLSTLADRSLVGLEVTGRHSGRRYRFPVSATPLGDALVVLPGRPRTKQWWRNVADVPSVRLLRRGTWTPATAEVLRAADPRWHEARSAYVAAHPRNHVHDGVPLVLVTAAAIIETSAVGRRSG